MEENKLYYTPKHTEFYLGFRYEVSNEIFRGTMEIPPHIKWYKQIFDGKETYTLDFIEYLSPYLKYFIRVKFLNKKDIIECGWKEQMDMRSQYESRFLYDNYLLSINSKTHNVTIHKDSINKYPRMFDKILFVGTIKNYNELKVLLKQLNIE